MPLYELYRHDITLYKAESATSEARIPADGATIDVYREGATTNGTGPGLTITVHDPGAIVAGDTIQIGTNVTTYTVVGITATTIVLSTTATWSDGDRIIPTNNRPLTYTDDAGGEQTLDISSVTTDSNGEVYFYTRTKTVDCITYGTGTIGLISDLTGSGGRGSVSPMDWGAMFDDSTDDAGAFNDAIEYLKAIGGGVLELPPGVCRLGSAITISTTSNIKVVGAGRGITTVKINHSGIGFDLSNSSDVTIESFTIQRLTGSADLIEISDSACSRNSIFDMRLIGGGIGIDDHGTDTRIRDVWCTGSGWTSFVRFDAATRPHVTSLIGRATGNWTRGIDIDTGTTSARITNADIAPVSAVTSAGGIGVHLRDSGAGTDPRDTQIVGCHLVGGTSTGTSPGVVIDAAQGAYFTSTTIEDSSLGYDINGGANLQFNNGLVVGHVGIGMDIDGGSFIKIDSMAFSDGAAGTNHIDIAATISDVNINGVMFGNFVRSSAVSTANGVIVAAGAGDRITISGVQGDTATLSGSPVVDNKDHSTSTNIRVDHNLDNHIHGSFPLQSVTYTNDDTTPSVKGCGYLQLSYGAGITVTDLDDGGTGQVVVIKNAGANDIVLDHGAGANGFLFAGGGDLTLNTGDSIAVIAVTGSAGHVWTDISTGVVET